MPTQPTIAKQSNWAYIIMKWGIAAIGSILIAAGAVNLGKTIYKSTLTKYPIEGFRLDNIRPAASPDGKDTKTAELTDEQKTQVQERETEQRKLAQINDYAASAGELLSGLGLIYVYLLIVKSERQYGRN